jgi:hypothetical protein
MFTVPSCIKERDADHRKHRSSIVACVYIAGVATNHTRLADAKQRPGKQRLLGNNLVAVNRALANHGLGTHWHYLATYVHPRDRCIATVVRVIIYSY